MARTARIAHVVLGSPYATGKDGLVPSSRVLKLHLWAVSSVARSIAAVLVVLSTDWRKRMIAGYTEVAQESASMPCPVRVMHVANNSLGSYGMYLHAFAVHRTSFDYYVASEVDYVPVHVDFGGILARLYQSTFADRLGFLVGVMQGHPFERSKMPAHPQGVHVMSTRTLEQLYEHTYARGGWSGSMTARMLHLVRTKARSSLRLAASPYDFVQVGFGMLLEDAGIEMRDFSSIYRTPYWNHQRLLDWTGVTPGRHVLHFIDNTWALAALVSGYATAIDSGLIVNAFHALNVGLCADIYFEYVRSAANIADLPSRGALRELLRVLRRLGMGGAATRVRGVFPPIESWAAPATKWLQAAQSRPTELFPKS